MPYTKRTKFTSPIKSSVLSESKVLVYLMQTNAKTSDTTSYTEHIYGIFQEIPTETSERLSKNDIERKRA